MEIPEFEWRDCSILGALLAFSDHQDCDARNKQRVESSSVAKKKTEILLLKVKSVVMENQKLELMKNCRNPQQLFGIPDLTMFQ